MTDEERTELVSWIINNSITQVVIRAEHQREFNRVLIKLVTQHEGNMFCFEVFIPIYPNHENLGHEHLYFFNRRVGTGYDWQGLFLECNLWETHHPYWAIKETTVFTEASTGMFKLKTPSFEFLPYLYELLGILRVRARETDLSVAAAKKGDRKMVYLYFLIRLKDYLDFQESRTKKALEPLFDLART